MNADLCGRVRVAGVVLACTVALTGCGSNEAQPAAQPRAPIGIVGVYEAVGFYPACGTETLDHQGVTWYPLAPPGIDVLDSDIQDRLDEVLAVEREVSPIAGTRGMVRVPAPGPGDNVGTLVVWADGVARWVSDSGDLDVWMIDDEVVYTWVC